MTTPPLPFDPIEEATRFWRAHGWADAAPGMAVDTLRERRRDAGDFQP